MDEHDRRIVHSSSSAVWRTPQKLFDALHAETGFVVDLAADTASSLCSFDYFGPDHALPERRNALSLQWASWYPHGTGFLNPPFSRDLMMEIGPWLEKAWQESIFGFTTYGLIPVRTSTKWWHNFVMQADEIRLIPHRVKFRWPDGSDAMSAPFDSCVPVWRPIGGKPSSVLPRVFAWDYK